MLAVQQNRWALEYVLKQTEELYKLAVQKHESAFDFVKEEICKKCNFIAVLLFF